jgi:hypothetical protein
MLLYWLVYRHHNQISVVIEPGASLIHARMRAALADWMKRLSQWEAKKLLAKFE